MPRKIIRYQKHLKLRARELRNNSTQAEIILWMHLKGKQVRGFDFHRQKPLSYYIVDFFCNELMLAIEIDGISHEGKEQKDTQRQKHLENIGISFLRFKDEDVHNHTENVMREIERWIDERVNTHPLRLAQDKH